MQEIKFWIMDYIIQCNGNTLPSSKMLTFEEFKRYSVPEWVEEQYGVLTFWQLKDKVSFKCFQDVLKKCINY